MNSINNFNDIINEIEKNLENEFDINHFAGMARMSVYEFRRIFSFVAGIPISDYIRKRRMSVAAEKLMCGKKTVTELATDFGYDSASSFSRAFKEFHGFAPKDIKNSENKIKVFTKIKFDFAAAGGDSLEYSVIDDEAFEICGIKGISDMSDTECCENVWNEFYELSEYDKIILNCNGHIYASYENGENAVMCCIGARNSGEAVLKIPKSKWVSFKMTGADDSVTNEFYNNVIFRWFESVGFERDYSIPNLEIFPENMDDENFEWEIRIPIK